MKNNFSLLFVGTFSFALMISACSSSNTQNNSGDQNNKTLHADCAKIQLPSGPVGEYCFHLSDSASTPTSIIYYFHGLGGSAEDIFGDGWAPIQTGLKLTLGNRLPNIVSLSFGPASIVTATPLSSTQPSASEIATSAFPSIEAQLGYTTPPTRHFIGASLGGFNALSITAAQPSSLRTVALLCPAIVDFDPFDQAAVDAYVARNSQYLNRDNFNAALFLVRGSFRDSATWNQSAPMNHLAQGKYDPYKIFLSIGRQDTYGFYEGASMFNDVSHTRGIDITWSPVDGGHCSFDPSALFNFENQNL